MLVQALQKGDYDVNKMITALEGFKFLAPKGFQAIRPQDHAMLQPMFRVKLVSKNGHLVAQILGTATTYETAPPIVAMRG
jgi:branched-chain amino acid transport system substrate-binding protein